MTLLIAAVFCCAASFVVVALLLLLLTVPSSFVRRYYSRDMPQGLRDEFVKIEGVLNPTTSTAGRVPKCYEALRKKAVGKHLEAVCQTILQVRHSSTCLLYTSDAADE